MRVRNFTKQVNNKQVFGEPIVNNLNYEYLAMLGYIKELEAYKI